MAMKDWNGDGKINGMDHYIEGEIFKDSSDKPRRGDSSGFRIAISIGGGLFLEALLFLFLGIEVSNVPTIIIAAIWIFFSHFVSSALKKIGV